MTKALLVVDAQRNMLEGDGAVPRAAAVRAALEQLCHKARAGGAMVVHVQNDGPAGSPDEPGVDGWELCLSPEPGELLVRKVESDTFASNPGLAASLSEHGVDGIVVCGLQSEYCVAATSKGALAHRFAVELASGAHATYDDAEPERVISARVESEVAELGVAVVPWSEITFPRGESPAPS